MLWQSSTHAILFECFVYTAAAAFPFYIVKLIVFSWLPSKHLSDFISHFFVSITFFHCFCVRFSVWNSFCSCIPCFWSNYFARSRSLPPSFSVCITNVNGWTVWNRWNCSSKYSRKTTAKAAAKTSGFPTK